MLLAAIGIVFNRKRLAWYRQSVGGVLPEHLQNVVVCTVIRSVTADKRSLALIMTLQIQLELKERTSPSIPWNSD